MLQHEKGLEMNCSVVFEMYDNTCIKCEILIWNVRAGTTHGSTDSCTGTLSALTPKQVEAVGVEELEAEEGKNDLQRERAAIHKVTVEQLNSAVKHYDAQVLDLWLLDVVNLEAEWYKQGRLHWTQTGSQLPVEIFWMKTGNEFSWRVTLQKKDT